MIIIITIINNVRNIILWSDSLPMSHIYRRVSCETANQRPPGLSLCVEVDSGAAVAQRQTHGPQDGPASELAWLEPRTVHASSKSIYGTSPQQFAQQTTLP